jgi:hypothetical protein
MRELMPKSQGNGGVSAAITVLLFDLAAATNDASFQGNDVCLLLSNGFPHSSRLFFQGLTLLHGIQFDLCAFDFDRAENWDGNVLSYDFGVLWWIREPYVFLLTTSCQGHQDSDS